MADEKKCTCVGKTAQGYNTKIYWHNFKCQLFEKDEGAKSPTGTALTVPCKENSTEFVEDAKPSPSELTDKEMMQKAMELTKTISKKDPLYLRLARWAFEKGKQAGKTEGK